MSSVIRFGRFEIRPSERRLLDAGVDVTLGSRAFDLLLTLVEQRDRVVSKSELLERVWPGLVVEENNLTVQISTLRKVLGAAALNTVQGRGYRFVMPLPEALNEAEAAALPSPVWPLPDKPSIAVLPFTNLSDAADQEYFSDGITEDILTELSRFHSLFVIARNSSFSYKGRAVDVRTVARELGVRYVLEGSIRKAAPRVRVTAQLIDALTGAHLWAEKYDRVLEDIFDVQEELTRNIVGAIAPQVDAAEWRQASHRPPSALNAYDLALRASAHAHQATLTTDRLLWGTAMTLARQALAIDAGNLLALGVVAAQEATALFLTAHDTAGVQQRRSQAAAAATRMIELDPSGCTGYAQKAWLHALAGRGADALTNARRACELNPNDVFALRVLGYVELVNGQAEAALAHAELAIRLSPRDPYLYRTNSMRATACFIVGRHAQGMEYAQAAESVAPHAAMVHTGMCLVAVGVGDIERARKAYAAWLQLAPEHARSRVAGDTMFLHERDRERVTLAWRIAAGLEDASKAELLR